MKKMLFAVIVLTFGLSTNPANAAEYELPPDLDLSQLPKIEFTIEDLLAAFDDFKRLEARSALSTSFLLRGRVFTVTATDDSHLVMDQKLVLTERMPVDPSEYRLAPVAPLGKMKNADYKLEQTLVESMYEGQVDIWDTCKNDYVTHDVTVFVAFREDPADKKSMPQVVSINLVSEETCPPETEDVDIDHSHGGWAHAEW
jgi:hypothetical protein